MAYDEGAVTRPGRPSRPGRARGRDRPRDPCPARPGRPARPRGPARLVQAPATGPRRGGRGRGHGAGRPAALGRLRAALPPPGRAGPPGRRGGGTAGRGDGRLGVGRRLRLLGLGTGLAARPHPGRGRAALGGLPGPVVAAGRAGLDGAAQPPVQGRDRRRRAHPRHLPEAGRRRRRHGGQGAVLGAPGAGRLGPQGGAVVPGRPPRVLAARVRREVRSKLETGRKHPARRAT
jgi:hypothetical protein